MPTTPVVGTCQSGTPRLTVGSTRSGCSDDVAVALLGGYDSVHLAATLAVADDELVLVTGDTELNTAAMSAGIAVAPSTR